MRKAMNLPWPVRGMLAAAAILAIVHAGRYADPRATAVALAEDATGAAAPSGELIYVPIYSSIYYEDGKRTLELAATLSIHNVNPDRSITVTRADYYNSDGKLIKKYVDKPTVLTPLQT
jgi:hypothetical protein